MELFKIISKSINFGISIFSSLFPMFLNVPYMSRPKEFKYIYLGRIVRVVSFVPKGRRLGLRR